MRLICYPTSGEAPMIIPAPIERDWMDATTGSFAYRCLPLNIANANGWLLLNTVPFIAEWNGGDDLAAITIDHPDGAQSAPLAMSHFGNGVLTFSVAGLFRTEPGYDLWVGGPANSLKDGIQPLTGIVEADWSPFTFTMNWRFTRPHVRIAFEAREPFGMIYPVPRGLVESVMPEFRPLDEDPELATAYQEWSKSRSGFNADLAKEGSEARALGWQKDYLRGTGPGDKRAPKDHRTKVKARAFDATPIAKAGMASP